MPEKSTKQLKTLTVNNTKQWASLPSTHPSTRGSKATNQKALLFLKGTFGQPILIAPPIFTWSWGQQMKIYFTRRGWISSMIKTTGGTWWLAFCQTCLCSPTMSIGKMERFGWCRKIQEQEHRGPWESWGIQGNHWPCHQCWLQGTNGQIERNSDDGRKFPNGSNGVVLVAELSWSLPRWYLGFRFPTVRPKPALSWVNKS